MKKLLLAAAFLFGVTLAFTSCNNGAYDADPVGDLSNVGNPLDVPGGAYFMSCKVDGRTYTGRANFLATAALGLLSVNSTGALTNETDEYQIQVGVLDYSVPGIYAEPDSSVLISLGPRNDISGNSTYTSSGAGNTCVVTITEVAAGYVDGTFSGRIRNAGAYYTITEGKFHVKKI